ncbi:HpcH/HpaI aldolase/citrate lyase family protein [Paenibacillus sp. GCM10023248]|uniref:HpcH/HpaI aldolase/citrate lyase family protein n=1 Tax=Bacillales TaxID=1385 RepID=UPI0023794341|nr:MULTISPECIES: HpcH/HpaI aldolase/citrate lyase family protein [Bacillales]MDD9271225.1 HpcH/HpaI aldolase/citrate lyase family protein [Paenibacillus sp. MAHUQ-63]MDR6881655.1 citrate lyase beta subunit [Bacillus sp. 3255]
MRYFNYLTPDEQKALFYLPPTSFDNHSSKEVLASSIGAALYMPATRPTIAENIAFGKVEGLVSAILDLEDAVGENEVHAAEESLIHQMSKLATFIELGILNKENMPLLFVRVRSANQLNYLIERLEDDVALLTGFVFPKFTADNGETYFRILENYNDEKSASSPALYGLPILESSAIIYKESRFQSLQSIKHILDTYKDLVLNVRIGATDFSSLFGLRRSPEMTIYDISPIRDCVADIINVFGRVDSSYVISGPVWEYFPHKGLIREVMLDKENGLTGKTIIHPTHIKPVQSLYTVSHEEYTDAASIVANSNGDFGVIRSEYANKMNEIKPHLNWARKILLRSQIYGVLHEQQQYSGLLSSNRAYV